MVAVDVGVILVDVDVDVVVVDELVSDEWKTNNKSCDLLLVFCLSLTSMSKKTKKPH